MRKLETLTAWRITLLYAAIAGVWVILADSILTALISNSYQLTILHLLKDWIFVIITILLVYFLSSNELKRRGEVAEALQASEEYYRTILENAFEGLSIIDRQAKFRYQSSAVEQILGFQPDELIGHSLFELIHPEDLPETKENFLLLAQNPGGLLDTQNRFRHKNGSWRIIEARTINLLDNPTVKGLVSNYRDITEQALSQQMLEQRVEERTRELSTLLNVSRNVSSTLELEALLDSILDQLKIVVDYTGIAILTMTAENDLVMLAYRGSLPQTEIMKLRISAQIQRANPELFDSRKPVIIPDIQDDTPLARAFRQIINEQVGAVFSHAHSWLGIPLVVRERAVGLLGLSHSQIDHFSAHRAALAFAFASQVAATLENARLYQKEHERRQALEALYRADEELYRHLHLDKVWQSLVDVAVDVLHVDKSATMVWDSRHERLVVQSARGFCPETTAQLAVALGEGLIDQAATNGEPVIVTDVANDPRLDKGISGSEEICSLIHVPIKINGQVFGVFNVSYDHPRVFSDEDRRLFTALAQRAALAIENARLYEQAQQNAVLEERQRLARELHDAVTQNLFSASLITEVLPELWAGDPEEGQQLLKDLRLLSRGALAEMRTLLLELRPTSLAEASLGDLLRQLADAVMGRTGIPVKMTLECDCKLPIEVRIGLYRIAQEALNNVAKHAHASQVAIHLQCYPITSKQQQMERVELLVEDNGTGFDPNDISADHLGLKIMRERATAIEARLMIESQPGQGTQITVTWPTDQERKSYD